MAINQSEKKRACIALIVCSTAIMFRACNGTLVKEEKKGVVVEPPQIEDIQFEDIYIPTDQEQVKKAIEEKMSEKYGESYPTSIKKKKKTNNIARKRKKLLQNKKILV